MEIVDLIDKMRENGFKLTKERSRRYPAQTITDMDYATDIALLANTPTQAKTLLHFHQKVLETIYILTHKPSLCKQRECLLGLNLITIWFTPPFFKQLAFFSPLHYSPSPLFFLNRVLDLAVISEDRNQLVVNFFLMIKICLYLSTIYIY